MISLFSINKFVNIECDDFPKNQWYNVDKSNKKNQIALQFLELEKTILYRQGMNDNYQISFVLSDLDTHLSNETYINTEGNKIDNKYVLLIPIKISTPDKYMFSTLLNNKKNCLIVHSQENYCIGFNDSSESKIFKNVIKHDKHNLYLFVHFTTKPFLNSLPMDAVTEKIELNTKVYTQLINKSEIEFLTIKPDINEFANYIENYEMKKSYAFLNFTNTVKNSNVFEIDISDQLINNDLFDDRYTNNFLQDNTQLLVFKTNFLLYENEFENKVIRVNRSCPNSIDSYILRLVEKYFKVTNIDYKPNYCITITISNIKPSNSIIMIPLSKTNETLLYFCRKEVIRNYASDKTQTNVNSIYILKQSNEHVYFINQSFIIRKENVDEKYCFITLTEPSYSDSDFFMNNKINKENNLVLEEIPIKPFISDIHSVYSCTEYEDFVNEVNQKFKDNYNTNIYPSNDKVILLSKCWFDKVHKDENEKWFDIVNYSNVINVQLFNNNTNDDIYKTIYIHIAPHITKYFNFEKLNVIKTCIYELTSVTQFIPPENCINMYIFFNHSSKLSIQCNNCTDFNPCCSPGSILIHTYKKEIIMKTDSPCNIFIFTIKIT